jgi:putative spermidine/putrescine transport system substrate-binding protein
LVNQFRQSLKQPAELEFAPTEQLNDLFTQLQSWRKQPNDLGANWWLPRLPLPWIKSKPSLATDLVTLGDYWLAPAIQQGLIQSLDPAQLGQWPTLPQRWQQLVKRNDLGYLDAQGKVWAAPTVGVLQSLFITAINFNL